MKRACGTPARIEERVSKAPTALLTWRDGDKWSIQENIGHLLDLDGLFAGRFDLLIFLTGVGTRMLFDAVAANFSRDQLVDAWLVAFSRGRARRERVQQRVRAIYARRLPGAGTPPVLTEMSCQHQACRGRSRADSGSRASQSRAECAEG